MIHEVHQCAKSLSTEFETLNFARDAFPMLTDWGVEDFSHTIHSLGCNYLSALGRSLGFWAISDYPVRIARVGGAHSVRPDVVWWDKIATEVCLLGEFERFDPRNRAKLVEKAKNLLQVHQQMGNLPRILLLVGWTLAGTDCGSPDDIRAVVYGGFRPDNAAPVPGLSNESVFVHATAVFGDAGGIRRLLGIYT